MWRLRPKVSILLTCLAALSLASCSTLDRTYRSIFSGNGGVIGAAVADEPRAAQIGREVLLAGGNAVDAATSMYFALSVTLPSMATLGGGGVCLVYRRDVNRVETLEFFARTPKETNDGASRPTAIPGNVRGFFALHERFGKAAWSQLLIPAEALAREGAIVSQALASHLRATWGFLSANREAARILGSGRGGPLVQGDPLRQLDLASTLAIIRAHGPGEFHGGRLAQLLIQDTVEAGGTLNAAELRTMRPQWRQSVSADFANPRDPQDADERWTLHAPPPPSGAGLLVAQMLAQMNDQGRYLSTAPEARAHLVGEVAKRAFVDRRRWVIASGDPSLVVSEARVSRLLEGYSAERVLPLDRISPGLKSEVENPAGTGIVTADREGNAVACTVTPNNPFGTGRVAARTGIFSAAAPELTGGGPLSLGPVMIVDPDDAQFIFAGTGVGGVAAATGLVATVAPVLFEQAPLEGAITAPRVHHSGAPDLLYHERAVPGSVVSGLRRRGHSLNVFPGEGGRHPGLVNAVFCPRGLPANRKDCQAAADPRGFGLALKD